MTRTARNKSGHLITIRPESKAISATPRTNVVSKFRFRSQPASVGLALAMAVMRSQVAGYGGRTVFIDVMTVFMEIPSARKAATRAAAIRPAATAYSTIVSASSSRRKACSFFFTIPVQLINSSGYRDAVDHN